MKHIYALFAAMVLLSCHSTPNKGNADYPISSIDIPNVVLNDSFWLPKIRIIQDTTIHYAFKKCSEEGRMDNFLIAGGKIKGKTKGKMPFDDTDLYKIIEGASYSLISQPNPLMEKYLDSIIDIIRVGQEPDGYISTWVTINPSLAPATWVKAGGKRWVAEPFNGHELYNSGHLFEAAAAHYWATGKRNFLDIALKNADLLVETFGRNKLQTPPGHQITETGLIKLYRITKNKQYLDLAKFLLDVRGDSTTHQLYGEYAQDHQPVIHQCEAVGHAVRAVYMYAGMTDIAALYQDPSYLNAVDSLWDNVVGKKMYLTGGIGSRHDGEAFGSNYELPNLTAYNETCAAIGDVYWNHRLFLLTGNAKYYDIIERSLYNGLISGISLSGKEFFYPNPLESDGKYDFNKGACTRSPWFDCSCCPTNLIRFLPSIPGLIYATKENNVYVNLFIANQSKIKVNGNNVNISLKSDYPWNGDVCMTIFPTQKSRFNLKLRIPGWAQNRVLPSNLYNYLSLTDVPITLTVNEIETEFLIQDNYINIDREWQTGDKVELSIPMSIRKVVANKQVTNDQNQIAFEYGPIVFCGEEIDNPDLLSVQFSDTDTLILTPKTLLENYVNTISGTVSDKKILLIPYYMWANRGVNKMKVWFPYNK